MQIALQDDRLHLSIDLEVLDTGHSPVIASIGTQLFSPIEGKLVGDSVSIPVDMQSQFASRSRTINQSTLLWWMKQSEYARHCTFNEDLKRHSLLSALQIVSNTVKDKDPYIWAVGKDDFVWMETAYMQHGLPAPWPHYRLMDYRTPRSVMKMLIGGDRCNELGIRGNVPHAADEDARIQAQFIIKYYELMKRLLGESKL